MKIQFIIVGWHFDTSVAGSNYIDGLIELKKENKNLKEKIKMLENRIGHLEKDLSHSAARCAGGVGGFGMINH